MIRYASLAFVLALASAPAVNAMPLANTGSGGDVQTQTFQEQIVQVRGGCGFGEHRGAYGGCRINNGPRGEIRAAVTGLPRGCPPGQHRGPYGRCHF